MVILFSLVKKGKKACKFEQIFKIVPLIFLAVLINTLFLNGAVLSDENYVG